MKKFIGIDLHSNNSVVVVSDDEDRVIFQKRMANDLKRIELALAPHRDETIGVTETRRSTFPISRCFLRSAASSG